MAKRVAGLGMLVALAFVFSYIEFLIPINLGIPGVKLGLANLVVVIALYHLGARDAFMLSLVRVILVSLTFGNMASFMYSAVGALLSFLVMWGLMSLQKFSSIGVSVMGGVFHNVGQILVAMLLLETAQLIYYLPVLIVSGLVSGALIGLLGGIIVKRIKNIKYSD